MEIALTARHTTVSDKFRRHLEDKLTRLEHLGKRLDRIEVRVDHEPNPRQADTSERLEITVRQGRIVVRAEASSSDIYAALDLAIDKLSMRLRRARDRQKRPAGSRQVSAVRDEALLEGYITAQQQRDTAPENDDYSPVAIRQKIHHAEPMTVDDALTEMELVGHDFYLFIDKETGLPSAMYRRRGWSYGVVSITPDESLATASEAKSEKAPAGATS